MKLGRQTYAVDGDVYIRETASIAGSYEANGAFRDFFDTVMEDDILACESHEKAEVKIHKDVMRDCMEKADISDGAVDLILGGDLINQIVPTSFSAREFEIPFCGLYNACATFGEALGIGALLVSKYVDRALCCTSSHYATAERCYRYPLELGTQATPASQWTVTGTGCALLCNSGYKKPKITHVTFGKIVDLKCTDANNMGAAMAPAAADTILTHLKESGRKSDYYDLILTGDLGRFGMQTLHYLCQEEGLELSNLNDCGSMIYTKEQKAGQGGSGAGCSSLVFCSYVYKEMLAGTFKRILLVPTGALLSKDSPMQGESIPAIAHAVAIEMED